MDLTETFEKALLNFSLSVSVENRKVAVERPSDEAEAATGDRHVSAEVGRVGDGGVVGGAAGGAGDDGTRNKVTCRGAHLGDEDGDFGGGGGKVEGRGGGGICGRIEAATKAEKKEAASRFQERKSVGHGNGVTASGVDVKNSVKGSTGTTTSAATTTSTATAAETRSADLVAFASFYDAPEEKIIDCRMWGEWLRVGWNRYLQEKKYRYALGCGVRPSVYQ